MAVRSPTRRPLGWMFPGGDTRLALRTVPGFVRYGHKLNGAWVVENVASVTSVSSTSFAGCAIALGPNDEVYVAVGQESGVKLAR